MKASPMIMPSEEESARRSNPYTSETMSTDRTEIITMPESIGEMLFRYSGTTTFQISSIVSINDSTARSPVCPAKNISTAMNIATSTISQGSR